MAKICKIITLNVFFLSFCAGAAWFGGAAGFENISSAILTDYNSAFAGTFEREIHGSAYHQLGGVFTAVEDCVVAVPDIACNVAYGLTTNSSYSSYRAQNFVFYSNPQGVGGTCYCSVNSNGVTQTFTNFFFVPKGGKVYLLYQSIGFAESNITIPFTDSNGVTYPAGQIVVSPISSTGFTTCPYLTQSNHVCQVADGFCSRHNRGADTSAVLDDSVSGSGSSSDTHDYTSSIDSATDAVEGVSSRLDSLQSTVESLSSTVSAVGSDVSSIASDSIGIKDSVDDLGVIVDSVKSSVDSLHSTVDDVNSTVYSVASDTADIKSKLSDFGNSSVDSSAVSSTDILRVERPNLSFETMDKLKEKFALPDFSNANTSPDFSITLNLNPFGIFPDSMSNFTISYSALADYGLLDVTEEGRLIFRHILMFVLSLLFIFACVAVLNK